MHKMVVAILNHVVHLNNKWVIAIAYIANMSLATITSGIAAMYQNIATKNAAAWFHNTTKSNAADMFHSTTVKHAADNAHNTIILAHVTMCQSIHVKNAADMFQDTITNTSAIHAQHHAHVLQMVAAHVNRKFICRAGGLIYLPDFFYSKVKN